MDYTDLKRRLRAYAATHAKDPRLVDESAAAIAALEAEVARKDAALKRQGDNMAFVLNHMTAHDQWYHKFTQELAEDRAALTPR